MDKDFISKQSVKQSLKMNLLQYFWLRVKSVFKKSLIHMTIFDYSTKVQDLVFNEYTMYQMYFDLQKMKKILLNHEAKKAVFHKIKFDPKTLLKSENLVFDKKKVEELQKMNDDIGKELWKIYQQEII